MLAAVRAREGRPVDVARLAAELAASPQRYVEAVRSAALSVGLYRLPAGSEDEQHPHGEEEVYLVMEGRARFRMGDEDFDVQPGALLTVPARVEHRFHSIAEDLLVLVFFAPAEGTAAPAD
jgi:mannose-6-phosphate isomerase-like protein (cupin superfamily)